MPGVYITHPTHRAGARPSRVQAPTATMLATPNASQCVHQPREGRGRNRQTSLKKKEGKQTNSTDKKRGGQEADTQPRSRAPTPQEAGSPPSQATRKATPSGAPERTPEDRCAKPGDTQPSAAAHRRKEHPANAGAHPSGEVAGRKKKHGRSRNERGRGDGDQENQDRDMQRRTPQSHDTTGPKATLPPPQPKKKQTRGGTNPIHGSPRRPPRHRQPHQRVAGNGRGASEQPHVRTPKPEKSGVQGKSKPTHTHQEPQTVKGERDQSPCQDTHTLDPSQEWQGYR